MILLKIQVQVPAPTCQLTGGLTQTVHIISAWVFFFSSKNTFGNSTQ